MPSTRYTPPTKRGYSSRKSAKSKDALANKNSILYHILTIGGVVIWVFVSHIEPWYFLLREWEVSTYNILSLLMSNIVFLLPFAASFFPSQKTGAWGVRQRLMLWQAATGGAALAIDWDALGLLEGTIVSWAPYFWVFGGAMGVWLEPAKAQDIPAAHM